MLSWVWGWLRRHPRLVDGVGAAVVVMLGLGTLAGPIYVGDVLGGRPTAYAIMVGLAVPLVWVRRWPTWVFGAVAVVAFVQWAVNLVPGPADLALLIALYHVAAQSRRRDTILALLTMVLGTVLAGLRWWVGYNDLGVVMFSFLAISLVAFVLGDSVRSRRAYYAELEARANRLEREREQQAQLAVADERARIAREMHDVVAHNVSVMVVQAEGASYLVESDPQRSRAALETVATTGRRALAEMRRLLGVLRSGEPVVADGCARTPQPGVADIDALVHRVRATGLRVEFDAYGDRASVPAGPGLVAYRVVQEALTNVLKHAGPGARVWVRLWCATAAMDVDVADDGYGAAADPQDGRGQGLSGMRERVAMYGGTLRAGPRQGGGFEVAARVPTEEGAATVRTQGVR